MTPETQQLRNLNRMAALNGVHRDSFYDNMESAKKFLLAKRTSQAARSAKLALKLYEDWPHLFGHVPERTVILARKICNLENH